MGIIERMAKAQSATVEAYVRQIVALEAERDMWKQQYDRMRKEKNKAIEEAAYEQRQRQAAEARLMVEQKAG